MLGDEVIEDGGRAFFIGKKTAAVEKDHERRGPGGVVLGGDVDGVVVRGAGIKTPSRQDVFSDGAVGNIRLDLRIRTQGIVCRAGRHSRGCK